MISLRFTYQSIWKTRMLRITQSTGKTGQIYTTSTNTGLSYIDFTLLDALYILSPFRDSLFPHLCSLNFHIEAIHQAPNVSRQSDPFQILPDLLPLFLFFNLLYQPWANEITQPSSNTLSPLFTLFFSFLCLWWNRYSIKYVTGS